MPKIVSTTQTAITARRCRTIWCAKRASNGVFSGVLIVFSSSRGRRFGLFERVDGAAAQNSSPPRDSTAGLFQLRHPDLVAGWIPVVTPRVLRPVDEFCGGPQSDRHDRENASVGPG